MRKKAYPELWERLHTRARTQGLPLRVMFELTYGCNFTCRHCYVPEGFRRRYRTRQLSTNEVFSVIAELKRLGCLYLGFTGGEPFVRTDIFSIIEYAVRNGFQVIVYTNGSLIDAAAAEKLARLPLNKIDITLPAVTDAAFDAITGTKGMRRRVFRAVRQLHARGIPLGFKTCVVKENASEVRAIRGFCRSLGAAYRLDPHPSPRLDGDTAPLRYSSEKIVQAMQPRHGRKGRTVTTEVLSCGAGTAQAAITPAGELKMCVMLHQPLYSIVDQGLARAWERLQTFAGVTASRKKGRGAPARLTGCALCPSQR